MRKIALLISLALLVSSSAWAASGETAGLHGKSLLIARGVKVATKLSSVCPTIVPWPYQLLYKSETSGHLSRDSKAGGTTYVAGLRCAAKPVKGAIRMYNKKGALISTAKIYRGNDGITYQWRAYSRGTGGSGERPSTILARLRATTRSTQAYVQFLKGGKITCSLLKHPIGRTGGVR